MYAETVFRVSFLVLAIALLASWVYFQRRAGAYREGLRQHGRAQRQHETGPLLVLRPLLGIPWYLGVLTWLVAPRWMAWSALPLPLGLRWGGVVLGALAILLLAWSQQTLGRNFVATLGMRADHALVSDGPYRWIQHP